MPTMYVQGTVTGSAPGPGVMRGRVIGQKLGFFFSLRINGYKMNSMDLDKGMNF